MRTPASEQRFLVSTLLRRTRAAMQRPVASLPFADSSRQTVSTEQNKRTACEFLQALAVHDAERGAPLLHKELRYWTCGKPHLFPYAGTRNKTEFCKYLASPSIFVGGSRMTPLVLTAEEDRVSMTAESLGITPDGRTYTNVYHYLFTFRDGRIVEVREYMDTQSAAEFFGL